ncbi:MAG: hypothetical protein AB1553_11970 [Nitrospirota bacterium]
MKEPAESSKEFLALMEKWKALEDKTIASADSLMNKTGNSLVKMIMESIKHDSEKHKLIQQMIIDSLTKEAVHISPDELNALSDMFNKHMEAEAESLCLADAAFAKSELFFTRFLLSYLIADEAKHHGLINQLNDLKRAVVPTSTGARSYGYIERSPSDIERAKTGEYTHQ